MADPVISGNEVFSHTCIGASDLAASTKFYDAALGALGIKNMGPFGDSCFLYGKDKPAFLVLKPGNGGEPSSNGRPTRSTEWGLDSRRSVFTTCRPQPTRA